MAVTKDSMGHLMAFVENASQTTVDIIIFTERNSIEVPQVYQVNEKTTTSKDKMFRVIQDYEFVSKKGTIVYDARKIEGISYKRHKTNETDN